VIVEVATTMVLLIGAGLMIRSFYRLQNVNPGFSYDQLTSFTVALPQRKYVTEEQRSTFFNSLLQNLRALPGVQYVGAASGLPLGNNGWQTSITIDGRPQPPPGQGLLVEACTVTPDYFRAMKIPLLHGRYFTDYDNRAFLAGRDLSKLNDGERMINGANVIIVDELFARQHWPGEEAVGKRVRFGSDAGAPLLEVVGVVGRVMMESLSDDSNRVQGYFSFSQMPFSAMTIIIKGSGDPNQLIAAARAQVKSIDPDQPIYNIRTMEEIRGESVAPQRLNLLLLSIFAGIAFVLAVVGIYGVMSYAVTQRTHEIGIRMAIGAQPRDVFRMILGQGMFLTMLGMAGGLVGAFALTRLMATMLFAVKPTDPVTFAGVAVLLAAVALVACYIPGRRATRVDPVNSLRYE
jgi:putative ABC transport system permease protein